MRDELLGYLLEALDDHDRARVEETLAREPALARDLETLKRGLAPLGADDKHHEPPAKLAQRTCEFVRYRAAILVEPPSRGAGRWRMQDLSVAAGIFVAATLLFLPAFSHSRFNAQLASCQNNLRMIGLALLNYSQRHGEHFPEVPMRNSIAVAGNFASRLVDTGFLECPQTLVCPSSPIVSSGRFVLPKCKQLEAASAPELGRYADVLGGSYAYTLGYQEGDQYHAPRNGHRGDYVVMADDPGSPGAKYTSPNHCGRGQNIWCEDGHVDFLTTCKLNARGGDDIFTNDDGRVAPGKHRDDSVVVPGVVDLTPVAAH